MRRVGRWASGQVGRWVNGLDAAIGSEWWEYEEATTMLYSDVHFGKNAGTRLTPSLALQSA